MKTFKFLIVLRIYENTDVFFTLDDNIYGIHSKRVNILYLWQDVIHWVIATSSDKKYYISYK